MIFIPTIETPRLLLRGYKPAQDFDRYADWCADASVMRHVGRGEPLDRAQAWSSFAWEHGHWVLRGYGFWAVASKESDRLLGRVGLIHPEGWPGMELAWLLAPGAQGYGYAQEAARAVRQYAFENLAVERLISLIYPDNAPSIRLAERLGAECEGETTLFGKTVLLYRHNQPA